MLNMLTVHFTDKPLSDLDCKTQEPTPRTWEHMYTVQVGYLLVPQIGLLCHALTLMQVVCEMSRIRTGSISYSHWHLLLDVLHLSDMVGNL